MTPYARSTRYQVRRCCRCWRRGQPAQIAPVRTTRTHSRKTWH